MTYTLWSHGRLLGELELTRMVCSASRLKGSLRMTDVGEAVLPAATAPMRIAVENARTQDSRSDGDPRRMDDAEHADFIAAVHYREALNLELRGPDGTVVPTQWIDVYDNEFLASDFDAEYERVWGKDDDDDMDIEEFDLDDEMRDDRDIIDEMFREREVFGEPACEETEFLTRYHIQVTL